MYPWAMAINEEETKIAPIDQNTDIYTHLSIALPLLSHKIIYIYIYIYFAD